MTFQHDKGWAWVIVLASFLSMFLNGVSLYTMGITHMALMEKFQESTTKTSSVVATSSSLFGMAGPIASLVINKTNCRMCHMIGGLMVCAGQVVSCFVNSLEGLIITYGVIGGIGQCLCFNASVIAVGYNFDRFRSLATGLSIGGCGIGMFCGPPLIQGFLDEYGVNGMFLLQGGMNANLCALALLMRPSIHEIQKTKTFDVNSKSILNVCKQNILLGFRECKILFSNLAYVFFILVVFTWCFSVATLLTYEPSISVAMGVASPHEAAILITVYGISNTAARYIVGFSTSKSGLDPMVIHIGQTAISGVLSLLFPLYYDTYIGHVVFCAVLGLYTGGLNVQYSPITYELVGVEHYASGFGLMISLGGAAYLVGPPLVGFILDSGGTPAQVYIIMGVVFLIGTFCNLICGALEKRYAPHTDAGDDISIAVEPLPSDRILLDEHESKTSLKHFEDTAVGLSLTNLYDISLQRLTHEKTYSVSSPHLALL